MSTLLSNSANLFAANLLFHLNHWRRVIFPIGEDSHLPVLGPSHGFMPRCYFFVKDNTLPCHSNSAHYFMSHQTNGEGGQIYWQLFLYSAFWGYQQWRRSQASLEPVLREMKTMVIQKKSKDETWQKCNFLVQSVNCCVTRPFWLTV